MGPLAMLNVRTFPFSIVVLSLCTVAFCQQEQPSEAIDATTQPYLPLLETLIDHVGEGRIDDAVGILANDTSMGVPESNRDGLKRTLAAIYAGGGEYDGHEVIAVRPISSRLHRVYALAYHQRQPLVYTFTMYQFQGDWKINHVHWDDNVGKLADVVRQQR